jgi:hypothetical protein
LGKILFKYIPPALFEGINYLRVGPSTNKLFIIPAEKNKLFIIPAEKNKLFFIQAEKNK